MKQNVRPPFFDSLMAFAEGIKRTALLILGGMLLFAGTLVLLGGTQIWFASRTWPQAPGKITRFEVRPDPQERRSRLLDLEYVFSVRGKRVTGTQLSPYATDNRMHVWLARWKESQYGAGQPIMVMYDPGDARRNFVEKPELIECLARFAGTVGLGGWMVYLFFRFRKRSVPDEVISAKEQRASIDRDMIAQYSDPIVLRGISSHTALGSLLSSWPKCRAALVVDRSHFAVIQGPYTIQGIASSVLTVILLVWLQSFWILLLHLMLDGKEIVVRRIAWNTLRAARFNELSGADPINDVVVYGLEPHRNRLWYRIERRRRDEFIEIAEQDRRAAEYFAIVSNEYLRLSGDYPS